MSTISNKFFVQVLEEGASLSGQLLANPMPTQAYNNGTFVPNWETSASDRPLIYLSLQNGGTNIQPDDNYTWKYNGSAITFPPSSAQQSDVTIGNSTFSGWVSTNFSGSFFKTTYNSMPALGIIKNLASSSNVDIDVITFEGSKTLSSNPISFSAFINVTITQLQTGGYLGVLNFPNGNIITEEIQNLACEAILYGEDGNRIILNNSDCEWFREGIDTTTRWKTGTSISISQTDVTDYIVLRCDFYRTIEGVRTRVYQAYGSIDDQQDPEFMWIKYNGTNGNSASLRKNDYVDFSICVGTQTSDTPNATWIAFAVKLLDSEGVLVTSTGDSSFTPQSDSVFRITPNAEGYRTLTTTSGTATAKVYYDDVVNLCKKGLTGVVIASTSAS